MDIPAGWQLHTRKSPLTEPWEPIYARQQPRALELALRVRAAHCNGRGTAHGGLIAALAANRSPDVAFVVLLSGPALPGDQIIVLQAEAISRAAGKNDEVILQQQADTERRLLAVVKNEKDDTAAITKLRGILKEST